MAFVVYVRAIPRLPAARQLALATESHRQLSIGAAHPEALRIYTEDRHSFPRERKRLIASLHMGDVLAVANFNVLARDGGDLINIWGDIQEKTVLVMELTTGRRSSNGAQLVQMTIDAYNGWLARYGAFSDTEIAAEAGAKGGKEAARRRRQLRMPHRLAAKFWSNLKLSNEEALAAMNADQSRPVKWSQTTAYRVLGPREAPAGRRRKSAVNRADGSE
jgi:hypothetical protein